MEGYTSPIQYLNGPAVVKFEVDSVRRLPLPPAPRLQNRRHHCELCIAPEPVLAENKMGQSRRQTHHSLDLDAHGDAAAAGVVVVFAEAAHAALLD